MIEPVMKVEVTGPIEFQAAVSSTLMGRSAVIAATSATEDHYFIIECEVPLNNMFGYSTELRGATEGKGEFTMEYARYAPVDAVTAQQIVVEAQRRVEAEEKQKNAQQPKDAKKKKK